MDATKAAVPSGALQSPEWNRLQSKNALSPLSILLTANPRCQYSAPQVAERWAKRPVRGPGEGCACGREVATLGLGSARVTTFRAILQDLTHTNPRLILRSSILAVTSVQRLPLSTWHRFRERCSRYREFLGPMSTPGPLNAAPLPGVVVG